MTKEEAESLVLNWKHHEVTKTLTAQLNHELQVYVNGLIESSDENKSNAFRGKIQQLKDILAYLSGEGIINDVKGEMYERND